MNRIDVLIIISELLLPKEKELKTGEIRVIFLIPNVTSLLQFMDQGINERPKKNIALDFCICLGKLMAKEGSIKTFAENKLAQPKSGSRSKEKKSGATKEKGTCRGRKTVLR
jgi:hypothetical protein